MTLPMWIAYGLIALIFCALACRARHMDTETAPAIVWQYRSLLVGVVLAPSLPLEWALVSVLSGVAGQLLISSVGWPQADIRRKRKPLVYPSFRPAWLPAREEGADHG